MRKTKCIIAACVTAAMVFQMFAPSTDVLSQEARALTGMASAIAYAAGGGADSPQSGEAANNEGDGAAASDGESASASSANTEQSDNAGGVAAGKGETGNGSGAENSFEGRTDDKAAAVDDASSENASADEPADKMSDSEDENDAERASGDYAITTVAELKDALGSDNVQLDSEGSGTIQVEVKNDKLLALSNTDPKLYRHATISRKTGTGAGFDVTTDEVTIGSAKYGFRGLGNDAYPFDGSFELGDETITLDKSLFNNVKLSEDRALKLIWKGADSQPIVANKIDGNGHTLTANVTVGKVKSTDSAVTLTSPLLGDAAGSLSLSATYAAEASSSLAVNMNAATGSIGLLANTVGVSGSLSITNVSGLSEAYNGNPSIKTESGNAGGLIGECGKGATVNVDCGVDLSKFTVAGYNASGGIIGAATNLTLSCADNVSVEPAQKVGSANSAYAGGLIGSVSFAGAYSVDSAKFGFDDNAAIIELSATKRVGGLFGRLDVTNGDVTVRGGVYKSKLAAGQDSDSNRGSYGGIAGNVCSTDASAIHALKIEKDNGSAAKIEIERAASLCYVGGIAGYQGDDTAKQRVAIVLDGAQVQVNGAAYAYTRNGKLGGAVGVVDANNVLDVRDFKLSSASEIGAQDGGSAGIAGSAWRGVIKFSGTTDLSDAKFADSDYAAQLVYQNYNALIFATGSGSGAGWTFKRPNSAVKIDDIYSYGEVIRLGSNGGLSNDLIQLDADTHALTLGTSLQKTNDAYVLNTANDFAKLAITWQTFGYYSMVDGISGGSVASLASSTIRVASTINLSGTGLTGLSKDRDDPGNNEGKADGGNERETAHYFSGTLTGNGSINLAVGEPYGMRDDKVIDSNDTSDGNGKIYRHQRLGLFSAVTSNARTDGGVTIGGAMRSENKTDIDAGSLAARVVGTGGVTISSATFSTAITFDSVVSGKVLNVGGIFGSVADACNLTFGAGARAQATISNTSNAADIRVGEAAGYVAGDKAAIINVAGLEVGKGSQNDIKTGDCTNGAKALVGGLIGYIQQGSAKKNVNITGLSYQDFSMSVGKNGDPRNGAGGLLGYSWGNAVVTIGDKAVNKDENTYALKTTVASVTADNVTEFGGLLYAMSGHLVINNYALDLSNARLSANGATTFGVLLARGGTSNTDYGVHGFGAEDAYTGLYLEDKAEWSTAYNVPASGNISVGAVKYFDEWVADTTKPGVERSTDSRYMPSTTMNGGCNGLISLHTVGEKLYMGIGDGTDNSYQNRTDVGKRYPTNKNARYYYNLDRCLAQASPDHTYSKKKDGTADPLEKGSNKYWIKSPEALMIWSACRNSPSGLYGYIAPGLNFDASYKVQIGNASSSLQRTNLDLDGYSYYPVDVSSEVKVLNTNITFHYTDIKNEQQNTADNKSNAAFTQHANMHLALFRVVYGAYNVENVDLAGSVGRVVNGSDPKTSTGDTNSGALFCRTMSGTAKAPITASFNNVVLNGLTVDGADSTEKPYAPLLMNNFTSYVTLDVQRLSASKDSYASNGGVKIAASSLFGNLGGENAEMVTAKFSNNISLPSLETGGIFTHASFLESFGYKAGTSGSSGSYIFYKEDQVTYGNEIDANVEGKNEYVGKQLWYYDEDTYGTADGLVKLGEKKADKTNPAFGDYLPYVAKGKSGAAYHELKVNQRVANVKVGCGTYADPYVISRELEIIAVSDYINNKSWASDGWEVTITKDQSETCKRRSNSSDKSNEITYKYQQSSGTWVSTDDSKVTLDNDTMHTYLQSAYYSIEPKNNGDTVVNSIKLNTETFKGFGNESNPFRGVIVGNLKNNGSDHTQLVITGTDTFKGLIPYSYGSVVKDLDILYQDGISALKYDGKSEAAVPGTFFGGVIGCIMGGDNIIDGVQVSSPDSAVQKPVSQGLMGPVVTLSGETRDSLLIPVGGYVGAICGGGVIFRNTGVSWRSTTKEDGDLYSNPYVGRVIDGYAFSEDCDVDNGNDNYQINKLENKGKVCVKTDDIFGKYRDGSNQEAITTTVENAQGLLVLSAIISSGAGAGACYSTYDDSKDGSRYGTFRGSNAYAGRSTAAGDSYRFGNDSFGKVRNATYAYVGKVMQDDNDATSDAQTASSDDMKAPGRQNSTAQGPLDNFTDGEAGDGDSVNSPYLVKNYATWQTGYVCAAKTAGMDLRFVENKEYDMRSYGTGFTGLSGRYYSNACYSNIGADRDRIVPLVACINGNGAQLVLQSNVKQYLNDDYFLQSWGGLFSAVTFTKDHATNSINSNGGDVVQNLQIGSKDDSKKSSVSLICVKNAAGTPATLDDLKSSSSAAAKDDDTGLPHLGVGALAGLTANRDSLASGGNFNGVSIQNCSVTGPSMVGGLLGNSGWAGRRTDTTNNRMVAFGKNGTLPSPVKLTNCSYSNVTVSGATRVGGFVGALASGSDSGIWVTKDDFTVGQNSTIIATAKNCIVGGAFGLSWSPIQVNNPTGNNDPQQYKTAMMHAVTIQNNNTVDSDGDGAKYRGTGGIVGNAQSSCQIKDALVEGENESNLVSIGGTASSDKFQSAGAVIGQINGAGDGITNSLDGVTVQNVQMIGKEGTGGLVGTVFNNSKVQCANISVNRVVLGDTYSGGLVGTIKNAGASLEGKNVKVENCTFSGDACSAIAGDGKGMFSLSNVLISKNEYQTTDKQGLLLGKTWSTGSNGDLKGLYVAGLDVVPEDGKTTSDLPDYDTAAPEHTTPEAIHKVSYVALADYNDASTNDSAAVHYAGDGSGLYNDERSIDGSMPTVASASPYVTTNPVISNHQVKAAANADAKSLFSDGAASYVDGGQTKLLAGKIKSEVDSPSAGKYTYTNIGGRNDDGAYQNAASYNPETADSMFNANNTSDTAKKADADFPVLLISGNDETTVESYLNVVTNGGFSDARRLNPSSKSSASHVTATTETFELQEIGEGESNTKAFVKTAGNPSLSVVSDGTSGMKFRASTDWDNEKGRFTLLTVTFHEAGTTYKVQVPIIVKRMLEIDFAATYSEGTNFNSADYGDKFKNHVLISSGDTMTGYLTWTYNQALGAHTEYGWNTLLASGGSMKPLNKTINFKGSDNKGTLPSRTQLTLIDTAHGNKEYHYTVGEGGTTSVKLTDFYRGDDNNKTYYQEQWLSETFGAAATQNDTSGIWVKTKDASAAGAKVGGEYYRAKTSADTDGPFYDLTVENEDPASESFYLIVRTPKDSARVNGYTDTSVQTDVNSHINYVLRAPGQDGSVQSDGHQGTASTYSIASNYTHNLVDNVTNDIVPIAESKDDATYPLHVDVSDTISFGQQEYDDSDKLYFQLNSSLVNYKDGSVTSAQGYPTGTKGTYSFYVTVGDTYYTWNPSSQESAGSWQGVGAEETPVLGAGSRLSWTADGSDMSLVLADAKGNPIDLSGLRKLAQNNGSVFTITMKADLTMSEFAGEQGIVASQDGNPHTKPSYRASLSTHSSTLSTSNNTRYEQGKHGYYRRDSGSSTVSFEASKKSQLGINLDDLSSADGTIGAIGSYDLTKLNGSNDIISKANKVEYTLSLQQRTGTDANGNGTYEDVNIGDYLTVRSAGNGNALGGCGDAGTNSFTWTDKKDSDGNFATLSGNSLVFQLPLTIQVDTTKDAHTYANYRLVFSAKLYSGDSSTPIDVPSNTSDHITYTLTRVNLKGISS